MKIKDKIKTYGFWVSIASAIILILKILGNRFGFAVDETMVSDLFTALCSVLVILGIIVVPSSKQYKSEVQDKSEEDSSNKSGNLLDYKDLNENSNTNCDTTTPTSEEQETQQKENLSIGNIDHQIENQATYENEDCNEKITDYNKIKDITSADISIENNKVEEKYINQSMINENNFLQNEKISNLENNSEKVQVQTNDENRIDINALYQMEKEKFSGNLENFLSQLENEIIKIKEKM